MTDNSHDSGTRELALLLTLGEQAIQRVPLTHVRSAAKEIRASRRLLIVRGPRGVGKTTLLQQHAKLHFDPARRAYFSLDDVAFRRLDLVEAVHALQSSGRNQLVLDEVHRYPDWEAALKTCFDRYPQIRLLVTGSSMLNLQRGGSDLSRRAYILDLPRLSFREFLIFKKEIDYESVTLDQICRDHQSLHNELARLHGDFELHFENYLRYGTYPALLDVPEDAGTYLRGTTVQTIDRDIAPVLDLKPATLAKLHKLLAIVAASAPFKPTISKLAQQMETSRELIVEMLNALDLAGIIRRFWYSGGGDNRLAKPDKIYLADTALAYAYELEPNRGTIRESFFFAQFTPSTQLALSQRGDFTLGKRTFELGGRGKGFSQIAELADGYLAIDTFEGGEGHRIPLYLFGFLR